MDISFLAIGDELLDGRVLDRNGSRLGSALMELGIKLKEKRVVPDDFQSISSALDSLWKSADLVVVSGGLGPTVDDMTTQACARWLGVEETFHPDVWTEIQAIFSSRGLSCPATNKRQAYFPLGAQVLPNELGTAPGFSISKEGKTLVSFPGVHKEFLAMLERFVIRDLRNQNSGKWTQHIWRTFGSRESELAVLLDPISLLPGESIHYQASFPDIAVLLSASHGNQERMERWKQEVQELLAPWVYGEGTDRIARVIVRLLKEKGWTLSTAESCTGGLIAKMITSVPGSSAVFLEGVVTYANESKSRLLGVDPEDLQTRGAVSQETVTQMAVGGQGRSGASVTIATSGIAGPGGGTAEKPVGTVHLALAVAGEPVVHKMLKLKGNRERIQTLSAWRSLRLLQHRLNLS